LWILIPLRNNLVNLGTAFEMTSVGVLTLSGFDANDLDESASVLTELRSETTSLLE